MGVRIELDGLNDILGMLDGISDERIIKAARRGMQDGLQDIRKEASSNCPVDTGALRNSIKTRTSIKDGQLLGEVYVGKEYGVYVEMGTGPTGERFHGDVNPEWAAEVTYGTKGWTYRNADGSFRHTDGYPARPYLYPAYKANVEKVYRKISRSIIREVKGDNA